MKHDFKNIKGKTITTYIILFVLLSVNFVTCINVYAEQTNEIITTNVVDDVQILEVEPEKQNLEETMTFKYTFEKPELKRDETGTHIIISKCDEYVVTGAPLIPVYTTNILIPYNTQINDIEIIDKESIIIPGSYSLACGQKPYRLSDVSDIEITSPDPLIYESSNEYPGKLHDIVTVQRIRGYSTLIVNLYPIQYKPDIGELSFYSELEINIILSNSIKNNENQVICRKTTSDDMLIKNIVDNPVKTDTYFSEPSKRILSGLKNSAIVDPADTYEYVIITNEALKNANGEFTFQDLVQSKIDKGLSATIVTVEEIEMCPEYNWDGIYGDGEPQFDDTACHIRNFVKDAYENWETEFVLLGGDGDGADVGEESGDNIVPVRLFFTVWYEQAPEFGEMIASDLYYACLDGNFDSNGNGLFGEIGDGYDIDSENGEVDLRAEVYIGRAPVDSAEEVSNFVRKTLAYDTSDGSEYLRDVYMVGEHLGFGGYGEYGGTIKDEVKDNCRSNGYVTAGISPEYDVYSLYDLNWMEEGWEEPNRGSGGWTKEILKDIINDEVHIINHLGHGNNYHVMKLDEPIYMRSGSYGSECHDIAELTNAHHFFMYSQACFPGAFDNNDYDHVFPDDLAYRPYDCIAEYMLGCENGAFACVANSRFGLGAPGTTNGPSQHYDREFFDALFGESIRGLGAANQDSKEDNIGKINMFGLRYCYYEVTLFGDPELEIKDPPLYDHDVLIDDFHIHDYIDVDTVVDIEITVYNRGVYSEDNIVVNFYIDNQLNSSVVISNLPSRTAESISFQFCQKTEGSYNIVVEIAPVLGEQFLDNNNVGKLVHVSSAMIKACVLESMGSGWTGFNYYYLNNDWSDYGDISILVDPMLLNFDDFTYEDIVSTNADILIIDNAFVDAVFWDFEYRQSELDAIMQYVSEGHGLIILGDSFGGNNAQLASFFGFSSSISVLTSNYGSSSYSFNIGPDFENHPLFVGLSDPFVLDSICSFYPADKWIDSHLDSATYAARANWNKGALAVNNNMVYISTWPTDDNYDEDYLQLLYNAIMFTSGDFNIATAINCPDVVIVNESVNFLSYVYGGVEPFNWTWDFGDNTDSAYDQNPVHIYENTGEYTVTSTVIDSKGNSTTARKNIIINDVLSANSGGPYEGIQNEPISLFGNATDGLPEYTFEWDIDADGDFDIIGQNPTVIYEDCGNFEIILKVTDSEGHTAIDITMAEIERAPINVNLNGPYYGLINLSVEFNAYAENGYPPYHSWIWDFGDGGFAEEQNVNHTYNRTGTYNVLVTATDSNGFNDTAFTQATIADELIIDAGGPYEGMVDNLVVFDIEISGGFPEKYGRYYINYDFGNGETGWIWSNNQISTVYENYGEYNAVFTVVDEQEFSASNSVNIHIEPKPIDIEISVTPNPWVIGHPIQFESIITGGVTPYECAWDFNDGFTSNEQNPSHIYQEKGLYIVTLTVTDNISNSATAPHRVIVKDIIVDANGPYVGVIGSPVLFEGSLYGGSESYDWTWDFGDGSDPVSGQVGIFHTYNQSGQYTTILTVTDNNGNSETDTANVLILGQDNVDTQFVTNGDDHNPSVTMDNQNRAVVTWTNDYEHAMGFAMSYTPYIHDFESFWLINWGNYNTAYSDTAWIEGPNDDDFKGLYGVAAFLPDELICYKIEYPFNDPDDISDEIYANFLSNDYFPGVTDACIEDNSWHNLENSYGGPLQMFITDIDYGDTADDTPLMIYSGDFTTYSWFYDSFSSDLDMAISDDFFYFTYQQNLPGDSSNKIIWKKMNLNGNLDNSGYFFDGIHPAIAAHENKVAIVYMSEGVVYCNYSVDGTETWNKTIISPGGYPDIEVIDGVFYCGYILDGNLNLVISIDGGSTWSSPLQINDIDGSVVEEYNCVEIHRGGIAWVDSRGNDYDICIETLPSFDLIPPTITNVDVDPEVQFSGGTVTIGCGVNDNLQVANVRVSITGPEGVTPIDALMNKLGNFAIYTFESTFYVSGTYEFIITAFDTVGNSVISDVYNFEIGPTPTVDYITITNTPDGDEIHDRRIGTNRNITGYASSYNNTWGYLGLNAVNWTVSNMGSNAYTQPVFSVNSTFFSSTIDNSTATWIADDGQGHIDVVNFTIEDLLADIYVDSYGGGDYTTIQEAIDNSQAYDIIFVYGGTYSESIVIDKLGICLIGEDPTSTIINGDSSDDCIKILADDVTVTGFTFVNGFDLNPSLNYSKNTLLSAEKSSYTAGIEINGGSNTYIHDNILQNCLIGVEILNSDNNTITDNIFLDGDAAVIVWGPSSKNTISNNVIIDMYELGIALANELGLVSNNIVEENTICNPSNIQCYGSSGIVMAGASQNTILKNNVFDYNKGCSVYYGGENNTISKNTLENNNVGVFMWLATNNIITQNAIKLNEVGISIEESNSNLIIYNNFIDNIYQVIDYGDNTYEENYWSDHIEPDSNSDGIVDEPYNIPGGNNQDDSPLTAPWGTNSAPYLPSNPNPVDGAIDAPTTISLSWEAGDPNIIDHVTYQVNMGSTPELMSLIAEITSVPATHNTISYENHDLNFIHNTKRYWQVIAIDEHGAETIGPIWAFTTEGPPNNPPNIPENPAPTDGLSEVSTMLILSWECSDPEGDELLYDVYFSSEKPLSLATTGVNITSFNPGSLDLNTTYYWQIVARDIHNDTTDGPIWSFTTAETNTAPETPTQIKGLAKPKTNISVKYTAVTRDPNFGDQIYYIFDWGGGTNTTTDLIPSDRIISAQHTWTELGEYQVRVKAVDIHGLESDWSEALIVTPTEDDPGGPIPPIGSL